MNNLVNLTIAIWTATPDSEQLKRHFEAVSKLEPDEQRTIMEVIDSILLKHDAKQYFNRVS